MEEAIDLYNANYKLTDITDEPIETPASFFSQESPWLKYMIKIVYPGKKNEIEYFEEKLQDFDDYNSVKENKFSIFNIMNNWIDTLSSLATSTNNTDGARTDSNMTPTKPIQTQSQYKHEELGLDGHENCDVDQHKKQKQIGDGVTKIEDD